MNKNEVVKIVADKVNVTVKDCEEVVNALFEVVSEQLANDDKVVFSNFGTFEVRRRKERNGRNPHTGETIKIVAQRTPAFKAGKQLKDRLR